MEMTHDNEVERGGGIISGSAVINISVNNFMCLTDVSPSTIAVTL